MSKNDFAEKQNNKLKDKEQYYRSYLELLRFRLEKKRAKKLLKYKESHSEEEISLYQQKLLLEDETYLRLKKENFDKKLVKQSEHNQKVLKDNEKRIWEVDFVRGVIIIGMLIDHFIGDFWMITHPLGIHNQNDFFLNMYHFSLAYWDHPARVTLRLLGVALLLVVSGISAHFSRRSWLHALVILACGGIMSGAFAIIAVNTGSFSSHVLIGAITCIGLCLLIYNLFKLLFYKLFNIGSSFKWFSLAIAVVILVGWGFITYLNPDRNQSIDNFWYIYNNYGDCIRNIYTPQDLKANLWKVFIGLNYFGSDWLALFPYLGYMFLGGFIGETVYKNKESLLRYIPQKGEDSWNYKFNRGTRAVNFCGQYSMWFYLLHQLVYAAIIVIIALLMGLSISI